MPKLKVQQVAEARGVTIEQLRLKVWEYIGTVRLYTLRRYWYGTKNAKAIGPPLQEIDDALLQAIADALEVPVTDLIDEA